MKVMFLFGAGASAFSGPCRPRRPPIGNELFSRLLEEGGAASQLPDSQRRIFLQEGFEAGMLQLSGAYYSVASAIQRQVALHLAGYEIEIGNHYHDLVKLLGRRLRHVCFSTLNYDLLLEQALTACSIGIQYNPQPPDFASVNVLKLHGSCNFLPSLGSTRVSGIEFMGMLSLYDGLEMVAATDRSQVEAWCKDPANETLHPIIAEYVHDKNFYINRSFIDSIHQYWKNILDSVDIIILVGVQYSSSDQHVWNPIAESNARLAIVNPNPDEILKWALSSRKAHSFVLAPEFSSVGSILVAVETALSG